MLSGALGGRVKKSKSVKYENLEKRYAWGSVDGKGDSTKKLPGNLVYSWRGGEVRGGKVSRTSPTGCGGRRPGRGARKEKRRLLKTGKKKTRREKHRALKKKMEPGLAFGGIKRKKILGRTPRKWHKGIAKDKCQTEDVQSKEKHQVYIPRQHLSRGFGKGGAEPKQGKKTKGTRMNKIKASHIKDYWFRDSKGKKPERKHTHGRILST